jgi:uncharacterized protein (TIGR02145 family)
MSKRLSFKLQLRIAINIGTVKKIMATLINLFIITSGFAQTPDKMSYQAVIRDADGQLLSNQSVGMRISILHSTANGAGVYVETHTPITNENGLISVEIGTGTVTSGDFSTIDWLNDPYFIKTETDPTGGSNYSITGTSQLLSVPYALHAKTAEHISGELEESDPIFEESAAASITTTDISEWNSKLDDFTETDPEFTAWDKSTGISITENQISNLQAYLTEESDPTFTDNFEFTDAASGDLLQYDGGKWVKVTPDYISDYTVSEVDVTAHQAALEITESQISDLGNYLTAETDPSVPTGTQTGEMHYWSGSAWETVVAGNEGQVLTFSGGVPSWKTKLEEGEVENPSTGKIWMDRNLGASQVATSSTDADAYGDLYQWGRGADGHQLRTSGTTTTLSTSDTPGHGDFILAPDSPYDWIDPQNDDLWQGVNGTNNPCPSGYRLPTEAEWEAERTSWSSNDAEGAFGSPLKLSMAGLRNLQVGALLNEDIVGYYWSSTVSSNESQTIVLYDTNAHISSIYRGFGRSLRCIKD